MYSDFVFVAGHLVSMHVVIITDNDEIFYFVVVSLVSSPEVQHVELTAEDLFLVIGCDGLWDVIDPDLATRIVLQQIEEHGRGSQGAQRAAEELQQLAYRLASSDNITVVVIMFTPLDVRR